MGRTGRALVRCTRGARDVGPRPFREARDLYRDGTNLDVGAARAPAISGAPDRCRSARPRGNSARAFGFRPLVERLRVEFLGPLNPHGLATVPTDGPESRHTPIKKTGR